MMMKIMIMMKRMMIMKGGKRDSGRGSGGWKEIWRRPPGGQRILRVDDHRTTSQNNQKGKL